MPKTPAPPLRRAPSRAPRGQLRPERTSKSRAGKRGRPVPSEPEPEPPSAARPPPPAELMRPERPLPAPASRPVAVTPPSAAGAGKARDVALAPRARAHPRRVGSRGSADSSRASEEIDPVAGRRDREGAAHRRHRRPHQPEAARGDPRLARPAASSRIPTRSGPSCASAAPSSSAGCPELDFGVGEALRPADHRRERQRQDHDHRQAGREADGRGQVRACSPPGDTFRAAATEQLEVWGTRVGATSSAARRAPIRRR